MKYQVSFTGKHNIFACENNMLSSNMKKSLWLCLHDKSCLSRKKNIQLKWFGIPSGLFVSYESTLNLRIKL